MAAFTSSFHRDVSLHGGTPPRFSPSTSLATLLMQLVILFHVILGSFWAFQSASLPFDLLKFLCYILLAATI